LGAAGVAGATGPFGIAGPTGPFGIAGAAEPFAGVAPAGKVPEKGCPLMLPPKLPENPGGSWNEPPGIFGAAEGKPVTGGLANVDVQMTYLE
jgi:hypothetical protein